ncbi:MAG TPA: GNAT family N-acetyltransferase [Acidimicrobiales bacterium]|nr:GNAT family N-acetyltransferase [Acidimicrobiales bacterium]
MRIEYRQSVEGLGWEQLDGFFVGWPVRPSAATLLEHLARSYRCVVAVDVSKDPDRVVGIATAISDGLLSASIPLVEVLPGWHDRGIGTELLERLLDSLAHLYMVDLTCDEDVAPFYARLGFTRGTAMIRRNGRALEPYAEER